MNLGFLKTTKIFRTVQSIGIRNINQLFKTQRRKRGSQRLKITKVSQPNSTQGIEDRDLKPELHTTSWSLNGAPSNPTLHSILGLTPDLTLDPDWKRKNFF
jgi:hypothetical protein